MDNHDDRQSDKTTLKIENYNRAYGTSHTGFTDIRLEEYAYELNYSIDDFFTEEDIKRESPKFLM